MVKVFGCFTAGLNGTLVAVFLVHDSPNSNGNIAGFGRWQIGADRFFFAGDLFFTAIQEFQQDFIHIKTFLLKFQKFFRNFFVQVLGVAMELGKVLHVQRFCFIFWLIPAILITNQCLKSTS